MADDINSGPTGDTSNTGDEAAQAAEDAGWDKVINEYAADKGVQTTTETTTEETTQDEQANTTTTTTTETTTSPETTTTTTTVDPNETPEQKVEREKRAADEAAAKAANGDGTGESEEADDSGQARRAARQTAREAQQQLDEVKTELIEKLYPDRVTELRDGENKPIKTIEDVMTYNNPLTKTAENPNGRNFNEEEAAQWLMNAQQDLNKEIEAQDKYAEQVANVQVDMSDQIESVNYQYGELLKSMPELRDELWAKFSKTVTRDKKSGLITDMPLSLEDFYETALEPYVKLAESLEVQAAEKVEADKKAAEAAKKANRVDRSDIFGHDTSGDDLDDEDKSWGKALGSYYGNRN